MLLYCIDSLLGNELIDIDNITNQYDEYAQQSNLEQLISYVCLPLIALLFIFFHRLLLVLLRLKSLLA